MQLLKSLYSALLHLYPHRFRAEFGAEMQLVFVQVVKSLSPGQMVRYVMHELSDLPGVLLRQYRQQPVWMLNTAESFPDESTRLEAHLTHVFNRAQWLSFLKWLMIVVLFVTAVPVHGYLYTVYSLHQRSSQFGVYPTLDEAIQSSSDRYDQRYRGIIRIENFKSRNMLNTPFIWAVHTSVIAESYADGSPIKPGHTMLTYYVHTKDGWVRYGGGLWLELGFLADWMKFYHLSGEGD